MDVSRQKLIFIHLCWEIYSALHCSIHPHQQELQQKISFLLKEQNAGEECLFKDPTPICSPPKNPPTVCIGQPCLFLGTAGCLQLDYECYGHGILSIRHGVPLWNTGTLHMECCVQKL